MRDDDQHGDDGLDDELDLSIHRADLDALVRLVDARCASADWAGLQRVRDRARHAITTGRQVWPAATLAEYRLALLAPAPWAAGVIGEHTGRFSIGPLTEVVAQHHTWHELHPWLEPTPRATYVAHERAIRGEVIDHVTLATLPPVLDVPVDLQPWEPHYALAEYREAEADFPTPPHPSVRAAWDEIDTTSSIEVLDDPAVELAVRELVEPWTASSTGRAECVCVAGDVAAAVTALGVGRARVAALEPADAVAWLGWAGASGGAHGRRRGAAAGRFGAWWLLGALGDLHDVWPPSPAQLEDLISDLRWWWWDAWEPASGWQLRLAVEDTAEAVAWAISASDGV